MTTSADWVSLLPPSVRIEMREAVDAVRVAREARIPLNARIGELERALVDLAADPLGSVGVMAELLACRAVEARLAALPTISADLEQRALDAAVVELIGSLPVLGAPPMAAAVLIHHTKTHRVGIPPRITDQEARCLRAFELAAAELAKVGAGALVLAQPGGSLQDRVLAAHEIALSQVPELARALDVVRGEVAEVDRQRGPSVCAIHGRINPLPPVTFRSGAWSLDRALGTTFRSEVSVA